MKFIESILLKDSVYISLLLHQKRVDLVFEKYSPENDSYTLARILPDLKLDGAYKVRLVYDVDATYDIEFAKYLPRKIKTLEVIHSDPFDYSMKYENRSEINKLVSRSSADDIIIAIKDYITDGSYFNVVFWTGSEWLTPNTPLLKGIRRTQLIDEGRIKEAPIRVSDLGAFEKVSLINAMMDLGELEVSIQNILKG